MSQWGTTALGRAARAGKADSVKCLLEIGANKEARAKVRIVLRLSILLF